ncbi:chloride channel protein [Azospirillum canadense]|uniref:chloride channel protein n=1 Tax=Azospirillum canadense TaxID=403962 RepID=UPI002227793D|nr:chloride channel protein [Azospirillum canadense]MCW2237394.1 CIC family chloride channel protein [Azospirillum canadense]
MPDDVTGIRGAASDAASILTSERSTATLTRQSLRNSTLAVLLLAAAIGGVIGFAVALLHEAVAWAQATAFDLPDGMNLGQAVAGDPWRIALVPAVGGLALGLLVKLVRRWRPNEIVDPVEANALYGGKMSLIDSLRLTLSTMLSNGSGASVGMEAAYTQAGSGLASVVGQRLRLRRADLRTLVGCGAAAAIAAAYDAPLAGAFYAFELVLGGYTIATLAPVGAAAVTAVAVANGLTDADMPLQFVRPVAVEGLDYVGCGVLGFLAGWVSILAMQAVTVAERGFRALPVPVWARPALGGLCLGALALAVPQVLGAGPGADPAHVTDGLQAMAILLLAKIVASALSLGSGFRGGLFSASLLLGGLFGGVLYGAVDAYVPGLGIDRMLLVLVGMGSVAAGIVGAPVTMVLLVLEATQDFWAASGVMIGVVVSTTVVRQAFGYSFATWRFHLRGVPIRGAYDIGWVAELTALRLMRADAKTVLTTQTVDALRRLYPVGSAKQVFAVEPSGAYAGVIDMDAVHDPSLGEEAAHQPVGELARHPEAFVLPGDDVRRVLQRFHACEVEALPVLTARTDRRIAGYITEAYALRRYSQELERQRGEELGERSLYGRD